MTQKFNFFLPIPELSMFVHKSGKRPFHARAASSNMWGAKTNFGFCTKNRNDSDFFSATGCEANISYLLKSRVLGSNLT